jgi:hypothetical protein
MGRREWLNSLFSNTSTLNAKKLGSVSTYSNSLEQILSDNKPVQNLNQPPFPVTPKDIYSKRTS